MPNNEINLKITIDGKEAAAAIQLTDNNIRELYNSFKYGKQEVNGLTTAISQGFNNAREIIQGFKETFSVLSSVFGSQIKAYQEQESALIKLNTALGQTGQLSEFNVKSLIDYSAELQRTTVYGDELTQGVMAQLIAMGLNVEQTKQATLQAANLATVMGTDLNSAARAMADLFQGNSGLIGRYVKGLDEAIIKSGDLDAIMRMLNERIGGQAVAIGQSSIGALAKMNNAIGDLKENTGKIIAEAFAPLIRMISDIVAGLNNLSPELNGIIGLTASFTTVLITLRVTGLLPAISSIELFGVALTGLKATLVKTGIGALIVALGYGLYELSKAYEHWQNVKDAGKESHNAVLDELRKNAENLSKAQLKQRIEEVKTEKDKLSAELDKLKSDYEKSFTVRKKTDKEGNEYILKYENEKTKELSTQIKSTEQLIKLKTDELRIYNQMLTAKPTISNKDQNKDSSVDKEFEQKKNALTESQRHAEAMLKLETENDFALYQLKLRHFDEMIELYKKYGRDVTELVNRRTEIEKEITKTYKAPEISLEGQTEDFELKNVIDIEEYKRRIKTQSRMDELNYWYETEKARLDAYEESIEAQKILDEEYSKRKRALDTEETENRIRMAYDTFSTIGNMVGQNTALGQAAAVAQSLYNTYEAASKALTVGPIIGPILAGVITALGLAQVAKIRQIDPPKGYAMGGRLKKGEIGFIEGYGNEIIAPEKTFVEVFKNELRPQIYSGQNTSRLENILINYVRKIEEWSNSIELRASLNNTDIYLSGQLGKAILERNKL
ncbi:MAG: hypothetical protein NZM09_12125 [Ignavibacterium sp.]|nr:hypothetical protein [Ignavibacterium sp.]MDW8376422.1 hypothetical protein [Ignavibacteriales bacterium]